MATTNFPLERRGDRTGNFVVDPVLALADDLDQVVVMPQHPTRGSKRELFGDRVPVIRFSYWWPRSAMRLAHGDGIPANLQRSWLARLQVLPLIIGFTWWITKLARDADLIHAHWLQVGLLSLPARWLWKTPLVVTIHGTDVTQFPDWLAGWILRRVDVVVSAHDDLLDHVRSLAPDVRTERIRHLVVPQPDEGETAHELDRILGDEPTALFVARLSPERDPLTFVRAAPRTLEDVPDAHFAVVGDGPLREEVEAEVDRLGLRDRIHVFGHRPDVWNFLRRADAFAALSDRNNVWVTALVEAMRAGVPAVTTTAGITAEALDDRHDSLHVPIGDADAVGEALAELLSDEELRETIADNAHRTLEEAGFDPDVVYAQTLALYHDLTS